jgi:hypothetical protein
MFMVPAAIYLLLCLIVGFRGRHTAIGYLGAFLLSLFLTPVVVFVMLMLLTVPPKVTAARLRQKNDAEAS